MIYIIILLVIIAILEFGLLKGLGDELSEIKKLLQEIKENCIKTVKNE